VVQQNGVRLRVLNVARKVVHALRAIAILEVVVEPAEQDLVRGKLEEVVNVFSGLQETEHLRVLSERDLTHETDTDDLPNETKYQVRATLIDIGRANVHYRATDGLGRVDAQIVVLGLLVDVLGLHVDDTLIDGVGNGIVDELAEQHSVRTRSEQRVVVRVNGQTTLQRGILAEHLVDVLDEGLLFLV